MCLLWHRDEREATGGGGGGGGTTFVGGGGGCPRDPPLFKIFNPIGSLFYDPLFMQKKLVYLHYI